jgi:RimJ/RimL family protein N-acetyltransferase
MPQPVLRTDRLLLVPLADRHLDLEVALDSDPEVLRFLVGLARSRAEVAESHAERMALGRTVDGLGYWIAFETDGGSSSSTAPERAEDGEFVGLMMLPPAHGADQPMEAVGTRYLRTYRPRWDDPLPGRDLGEVEYELTREMWP